MGSQRVRHDWATELTELNWGYQYWFLVKHKNFTIHLSIHHLSIQPATHLSKYPFIHSSIHPSKYPAIYPSNHPFIEKKCAIRPTLPCLFMGEKKKKRRKKMARRWIRYGPCLDICCHCMGEIIHENRGPCLAILSPVAPPTGTLIQQQMTVELMNKNKYKRQ